MNNNPNKKVQAVAKVQVTIEVVESVWGHDCSIGQLYRQAATGGVAKVQQLFKEQSGFRIVGEPKIIGILTEDAL